MNPSASRTREAWRQYLSRQILCRDLLRETTYRAWERCHLQHTNPTLFRAESLSESATENLLETRRDLIEAAAPYMHILSDAVAGERHAIMLADESATVLNVIGDPESLSGPNPVPEAGSLLSEKLGGSNGIGTPLVEKGYVEIEGAEHFIQGFHPFTCQGIPIRGEDGEIVGALSSSVRDRQVSKRIRALLVCASLGIEAELVFRGMQGLAARLRACDGADGARLEALRQDVVQSLSVARFSMEMRALSLSQGKNGDSALLVQATAAAERFKAQAESWRHLVTPEASTNEEPTAIANIVATLVDLLDTECSMRDIHISLETPHSSAVTATPGRARRRIFGGIVEALSRTRSGGHIAVRVFFDQNTRRSVVSLSLDGDSALDRIMNIIV